jgi:hypothetical protein
MLKTKTLSIVFSLVLHICMHIMCFSTFLYIRHIYIYSHTNDLYIKNNSLTLMLLLSFAYYTKSHIKPCVLETQIGNQSDMHEFAGFIHLGFLV